MKLFLHTLTGLRIINEPLEWSGTAQDFLALEPLYPGLPTGASVRYQTEDLQYYEDSHGRHADVLNCLPYCDQVATYLISGCVYVHVNLSDTLLNVGDPDAHIDFSAHIKLTADPESSDLPVTATWIIRPWHENGDRDALLIHLENGACDYTYTYKAGLSLGDWSIREADFMPMTIGGTTYNVKLANPVKYTLYRELI